ncbi:MAG: DUF4160 domain-containing protein [Saprospiraceae bacterium]|nr:DUF4160 domain-containing protein [Saprospiraceae bacterium]
MEQNNIILTHDSDKINNFIELVNLFNEKFFHWIPKRQLRLVQAWIELHREELYENFKLLTKENPSYFTIDPL